MIEFPDVVVMFWLGPPFTENVNVYGGMPVAPVNVMTGGGAFRQTPVVPLMVAVGAGYMVMVEVAVTGPQP